MLKYLRTAFLTSPVAALSVPAEQSEHEPKSVSLASPTTIDGLMSRENVTCVEIQWALRSGESKYPQRSCDGINETVSGNVSRQ